MQGNALARRRDEEGHRDESCRRKVAGVKRGNLHPEQHQIGKRGMATCRGRLGRGLRVGGSSREVTSGPEEWLPGPPGLPGRARQNPAYRPSPAVAVLLSWAI